MEEKVRCPSCGLDIPVGKRFCGHCGVRLVIQVPQNVCSSCGAENQPDQQFCSTCGRKLAAPAATLSAASAVEGKPVTRREQVTMKPTWGLAWGLWWRMLLLSLLFSAGIYLLAMLVTIAVLGWAWKLPFGP